MKIKQTIALAVISVSAIWPSAASAQHLKYDNQQQLMGAALMSPVSGQEVLQRIFAHCASSDPIVQAKQHEAMHAWLTKHQSMIDENLRLREEYRLRTTDEGREMLKSLLAVQGPQVIEAQVRRYTVMVDVAPDSKSREQLCLSIAESVVDGQWDIEANDPALFEFLQHRIAARK